MSQYIKKLKPDKFFMQAVSELGLRGVTEVWCHTVLLAAQHKRAHPALTLAGEGWYSIYLYPGRMEGRVGLGALATPWPEIEPTTA